MVWQRTVVEAARLYLSVLALSSRFDGHRPMHFLCIAKSLSVLALSSRFDGRYLAPMDVFAPIAFSTRSVESF